MDPGDSFRSFIENKYRRLQEKLRSIEEGQLFANISFRVITKFGSFLMLLMIAIDPFSQQLVQIDTVVRFVPFYESTIARAMSYTSGVLTPVGKEVSLFGSKEKLQRVSASIDPTMEAAILAGLFNEGNSIENHPEMDCSAAYCPWGEFLTAGACYECNDITSHLVRHDKWAGFHPTPSEAGFDENVSAYFLPNGAFLANMDGNIRVDYTGTNTTQTMGATGQGEGAQMMGFSTGDRNETVSMKNVTNLIWSLSAVYINWTAFPDPGTPKAPSSSILWPDMPVIASECAVYFCGLEVSSNVTNTTLMETMRELSLVRSPESWQFCKPQLYPSLPSNASDSLQFDPSIAAIGRSDLQLHDPSNTSVKMNLTQAAVYSISSYLQSTFQASSNVTIARYNPGSLSLRSSDMPKGRANIAYYTDDSIPQAGEGIVTSQIDIIYGFYALADSMTTAIRNSIAEDIGKPGDPRAEQGQLTTV